MSKIFWQARLLYPALIGASVAIAPVAMATDVAPTNEIKIAETNLLEPIAAETELKIAQTSVEAQTPSVDALNQINTYGNEGKGDNSLAQVTSVSQLSDVQPTDWAFQAL